MPGVGKLAGSLASQPIKALNGTQLNNAHDDMWGLINRSFYGYGDIPSNVQWATPEDMSKVISDTFAGVQHGTTDLSNFICVSDTSDLLDKYTNGAYTRELGKFIKTHGPVKVAKLVFEFGNMLEGYAGICATMGDLVSKFPAMAKVFSPGVFTKALTSGDPRGVMEYAVRYDLLPPDTVKDILNRHHKWNKEKRYRESENYIKDWKPSDDDHIYGSSMHQPFESKLTTALNKLVVR